MQRQTGARKEQPSALPWWVPDWRFPLPIAQEREMELMPEWSPYGLWGELQARIDGRLLILSGWLYDEALQRGLNTMPDSNSTSYGQCASCYWALQLNRRLTNFWSATLSTANAGCDPSGR